MKHRRNGGFTLVELLIFRLCRAEGFRKDAGHFRYFNIGA